MEKPTIKLKTIHSDKVVTIEVGSGFYSRVQKLLFTHINSVEPEVSIKALNEIKSRDPKDEWEANLLTLLTLVYNIEAKFHEQGFTTETDFPLPQS